ncbi:MAG TPA: hypothetical protein VMB71_02155 [Acetobacteraceae bacterium]|nr:hypothetical protein [Acetobacteraceae bacterium]
MGAGLVFWATGSQTLTGTDDANITFVYARNLARGFGYVYTPGGEHVEGSTSLLWTLIVTVFYSLFTSPEPVILVVNIALTIVALGAALSSVPATSSRISFLLLLVLGLPAFFFWTTISLMDEAIWCAFVSLTARAASRLAGSASAADRRRATLWFALSPFVRPEAVVLLPGLLVGVCLCQLPMSGLRRTARVLAFPVLAATAASALLAVARKLYFGDFLPNTYYAKVSSLWQDNVANGLNYDWRFLGNAPLVLLGVIASIALLLFAARQGILRRETGAPYSQAVVYACGLLALMTVTALEGGDFFFGFRLLAPAIPLSLPPILTSLSAIDRRISRKVKTWTVPAVLVLALAADAFSVSQFRDYQKRLAAELHFAVMMRTIGCALNTEFPNNPPIVGSSAAGGIALTYHGRIQDEMGLNWRRMAHATTRRTGIIAHSAFDSETFLREPPDILLVLHPADGPCLEVGPFNRVIYHDIFDSPQFRRQFVPARFAYWVAFQRRGYRPSTPTNNLTVLDWSKVCSN